MNHHTGSATRPIRTSNIVTSDNYALIECGAQGHVFQTTTITIRQPKNRPIALVSGYYRKLFDISRKKVSAPIIILTKAYAICPSILSYDLEKKKIILFN